MTPTKQALSLKLGGLSIDQLLEARRRTGSPTPETDSWGPEEISWRPAPKLSLDSMLSIATASARGAEPDVIEVEAVLVETGPAVNVINIGETAAEPTTAAPDAAAQEAANHLKAMLAVRDWADPHNLLSPGLDAKGKELALSIVAPEVKTDVGRRAGKWYLDVSARRRILANFDPALLLACTVPLDSDDEADPVRAAFAMILAEPPQQPSAATDLDVLRALFAACDWHGGTGVSRDHVAALIEMSLRRQDVDRITAAPLIGRTAELARLDQFLSEPRTGQRLAIVEMFGLGGTGKSTLLAHLEKKLRDRPDTPVLVHLDFDRETLDAEDPFSLDLALLDAIAAARPDRAPESLGLARELAALRLDERADRQSLIGRKGRRLAAAAARRAHYDLRQQEALESASSTEESRRLSLLWGRLGPHSTIGAGLRLALVLDTLENVFSRGVNAMLALARWLDALAGEVGAEGACVILSGRDPPESRSLAQFPYSPLLRHELETPPIGLGEFTPEDAVLLLEAHGVHDKATAEAAAAALPRLPLLLRIAAEVLTHEKELAAEVREAHAEGRIDTETSRRYLTHRIVRHVTDEVTRDYVLAALALPEVTLRLVRRLVVPVVDETLGRDTGSGRARHVYETLAEASWLTTRAPDLQSFTFHPALRTLALRLIESDPTEHEIIERVRAAAIALHLRGRSPKDHAFKLYHRLMLGHPVGLIDDREAMLQILARFLDDLPEAARAALRGEEMDLPAPDHHDSDAEWRAYLEGVANAPGQGHALVQRGEARTAIELYSRRPTRPIGAPPPDFIIQAFADLGDWDQVVSIDALLAEIADASPVQDGLHRVPPTLRSRLYWTTRLALLRRPGPLTDLHEALLTGVSVNVKGVKGVAAIPAIVAVAEAFSGSRLGPASWLQARGSIGRVVRYPLVQGLVHGTPVEWKTPIESIAVLQRDWADRIAAISALPLPSELLSSIQARLDALHQAPLPQVNRLLRELRQPIRLATGGLDPADRILLLRGKTVEFLRPLATQLATILDPTPTTGEAIRDAYESTIERMSILPVHSFPLGTEPMSTASSEKVWLGLIDLFDFARLLPHFCRRLGEIPESGDPFRDYGLEIRRVARTYLAWDAALTRNGSSDWGQERAGEWEPREPTRAMKDSGDAEIFRRAEDAVSDEIVMLRPDLSTRWRTVIPRKIGLDADNWLEVSGRMVERFNFMAPGAPPVHMAAAARSRFHAKPLTSFAAAIADLGERPTPA